MYIYIYICAYLFVYKKNYTYMLHSAIPPARIPFPLSVGTVVVVGEASSTGDQISIMFNRLFRYDGPNTQKSWIPGNHLT